MQFINERAYEWLVISQSYLQCALISARILKQKLSKFQPSDNYPRDLQIKEWWGDYPHPPEYLIFPIIFNFKHGIEIYLKAIAGIKNSEFDKNHNLLSLMRVIEDEEVKSLITKYAFSRLLLPNNNLEDSENQFERYPQNNPYDGLEFFLSIDEKGVIDELIKDIEFLHKKLREYSNSLP